jgi:toluene monooxygenase system ferredoxin subunit
MPLFKDLSPEVIEKISELSQIQNFKNEDLIFKEGGRADQLHFLISGAVVLKVKIMTKPDSVTVSYIGKSFDCFGWSGLVSPHYYTASATCEEDSVILTVNGDQLLKILKQSPEDGFLVMHRIANLVSDRLRNSRQALIKTM